MVKAGRQSKWPTREAVRNQLFFVWCFLLIFYVTVFLLTSFKPGVHFQQAADAAWKVAYLVVPVLGAFAGFWFSDIANRSKKEETRKIDPQTRRVMFVITFVLHFVVLLFIVFGVFVEDFYKPEGHLFYEDNVDVVMKILLLIWSVSLLPVGWILKGQELPKPNVAP